MIPSLHRPTQVVVETDKIRENIATIQAHLPKETQTFAVVKANAYGHGAQEVAQAVEDQVDAFCVSNLDEALELRTAGIAQDILILGVVMPDNLRLARAYRITLTVASLEWLDQAQAFAKDLRGLQVHLKVDSGMGRIGFRDAESLNSAMDRLEAFGCDVAGIFTHFATADEADTDFFEQQLSRFKAILADVKTVPPLVHSSNSATSLWHADTVFNAVRLGAAMYGINPSGQALDLPYSLQPALSITSELVHVKEVAAGSRVGYGATYVSLFDEVIGTLPIGYADGYTRDMQDFYVLVDGHYCPVVGRVSMDQITVRLPKLYPIGTRVTLLGKDGANQITATDIAEYRQTINYEVLCLLSDRIPRVYR